MGGVIWGFVKDMLVGAAICLAGFFLGIEHEGKRHQEQLLAAAQTQVVTITKEVDRGKGAATRYMRERDDLQARYQSLEAQFNDQLKDTPLVRGQVAADLVLSADAVRLWNAALLGTALDKPVSGSACGAAEQAEASCDADAAEVTLADAWRNHKRNAATCAEDRLRYERLIDFLTTPTTGKEKD